MSLRDAQVLIALNRLSVTSLDRLSDEQMSYLTGLTCAELWSTYRNLSLQGLIEYQPVKQHKVSWVALTKKGHQTSQKALQATLVAERVKSSINKLKTVREA